MLAIYRLRCDHSLLIWPRSLTALHNTSDAPVVTLRRLTGHFNTIPSRAPPVAGPTQGERGVASPASPNCAA
jgi:hypothetical protein